MRTEQPPRHGQSRTRIWNVRVAIVEEGDVTRVHAVLDTGDRPLHADALSRRSPDDRPVPEIGDEFAAGRALVDLGHRLLHAGTTHAQDNPVAVPM